MKHIRTARVAQSGLCLLAAMTLGLVLSVSGQTWQGDASKATPMDGAELFKTFCASCHGAEATGNGPMARVLRHAPPDLTLMAKKNGGTFPTARLNRIIAGWDIESHGDRDMPVWGDVFTKSREAGDAERHRISCEANVAGGSSAHVWLSTPMTGVCAEAVRGLAFADVRNRGTRTWAESEGSA